MASSAKLFSVVLLALVSLCASSSWTQDSQIPDESQAIPELPPEKAEDTNAVTKTDSADAPNAVVNYDDSAMRGGNFANNIFSEGPAKNLNLFELDGYFRTRFSYFRDGHLRTYIPSLGRGTSNMPPSLSLLNQEPTRVGDDETDKTEQNPGQNNFSGNMRLRLNPTINVAEMVRVKASLDVFDNMVLGSTPSYLAYGMATPSWPVSAMSMSQNSPLQGINSMQSAISMKRAWGEVSFPVGELRFGRMPYHWGLGILYHSGDGIDANYGDQIDGVSFTTRVGDFFISPGYSIAYTGPVARGGGQFRGAPNAISTFLPTEAGQRYPLESGDMTHVFNLSFLKRDSDFLVNKKRDEGRAIFDYGILGSFRRQFLDSQAYAVDATNLDTMAKNVVKRESNVGAASMWTALSYGTFHLELELAGIWGKYQIGERDTDVLARKDDGTMHAKRNVWLLQGGAALESRYGFLNDRLQVGLDGGIASSQSGPGFGMREGAKKDPKPGDADGEKLPSERGYKTNFRFNPAYTVDRLLYREVLGGISGSYYIKPHIAYFFSRNFGVRGDVLTALAQSKSNTTGGSNWLGLELDATTFLRTESGFYFQLAYGVLFPFKGLDHRKSSDIPAAQYELYGDAKIAQTVQGFLGITF